MATLVKLNSVASASLVKVDGVAMAGISKIIGETYSGAAAPTYLDLTTFTEVDEDSDITVTADKVDVSTMRRDAFSHVYYDFYTGYFQDFEIQFEFEVTAGVDKSLCAPIIVSNTIEDAANHSATANDGIMVYFYVNAGNFRVRLIDCENNNTDDYFDGGTTMSQTYCTFKRVGTTATLQMYSDSGRTTLIDTLSITCVTESYRYLYALNSWGDASADAADSMTLYTQNFELVDPDRLDLTGFTEVDSAAEITVNYNRAAFTAMRRDSNSYVYKDYTAGYFGDFIIDFECEATASDAQGNVQIVSVSDTAGTNQDMQTANDGIVVWLYENASTFRITLQDYNTDNSDFYVIGGGTTGHLYCRLKRDGTVASLEIYTDETRETMADNLNIVCESGTKQYLGVLASRDTGTTPADTMTGYSQNVELVTAASGYEDLTTYTEVDPGSDLVINDTTVYINSMRQDAANYLYYDHGAANFGDFDIEFESQVLASTDTTSQYNLCNISNTIGTWADHDTANDGILVDAYNAGNLYFRLRDMTNDNQDLYNAGNVNVTDLLYYKLERSTTTCTLKIYSDKDRSTLVDTLTITCGTGTYRYLYAMNSRDAGVADTLTAYNRNFNIITAA